MKTLNHSLIATAMMMAGPMSAHERQRGRYLRDAQGHGNETMADLLKRHTDAIEAKFGSLKVPELRARLEDIEQKAARPGGGGGYEVKSFGAQVLESDAFKGLEDARFQGRARIELKAITNATSGMAQVDYYGQPLTMTYRQTRVRDLLTVMPTEALQVQWVKQVLRDNKAAPVAEGNLKPYSNYSWAIQTVTMRTIAHLAKLTRQAMDDAPQLQATVDLEMRYGLQLIEDAQILYGDGTGENLIGLLPQATPYAAPPGFVMPTGPTLIDKLGGAILQQALTDYPADGVVLHPTDWMVMRMLKDSTGSYLFGKPGEQVAPSLFGLPIALTQAIAQGSYLLGAFKPQVLWDRLAPEVLISSENVDDFEKNLLTMRAEQRVALAARCPSALVKGTF